MTAFLRRRPLSRRTFLRGAGALISLPWLDAMVPALERPATIRRCVFLYAPNGQTMPDWRPKTSGRQYELPFLLQPLKAHRNRMLVVSGLDLDGGRAHGDGPGDHARSAASFLTTAHPLKTGGANVRNGVSVDQVLARHVGQATRFASLELGLERGRRAGACDSGYACAYSHSIAWSSPTTPVAKESDPREVFRRLFGDPDARLDAEAQKRESALRRSVLDTVHADAKDLARKLGAGDRARVTEYLDSIRALERRLEAAEQHESDAVAVPEAMHEPSSTFESRVPLMYELIALALQTDSTRVVTHMLGNAGSNVSYRFLDVPEGHHYLSHHGDDADKIAKVRKINRWHTEQFAAFADRLAAIESGSGANLLEDSIVLYGSGLADGNRHNHDDLPILVLGNAAGAWRGGRHLRADQGTPLGNLYVSILRAMGAEAESFGDSTGPLLD